MLQAEENYRNADTLRKQLEVELRQVVVRLEQTEATALREGKKLAEKLQNRVSALERTFADRFHSVSDCLMQNCCIARGRDLKVYCIANS